LLYAHEVVACRRCLDLAYESQQESPRRRALNSAQRIRIKLGGTGLMLEPFPSKPKYLHWKTYHRLRAKAELQEAEFTSLLGDLLDRLRHGSRGRHKATHGP
jgi:hypothetical protein